MFQLDKTLSNDCYFILDLEKCSLLLMNNANFLWLILVPRIENACELIDVKFEDQVLILKEINVISKILQEKFNPEKINIATIGNIVRQLHFHIVARFKDDIAFPSVVWGKDVKKYQELDAQNLIRTIIDAVFANKQYA